MRDERQQVEWVARGKYPISLGSAQDQLVFELQKMGLPLQEIVPEEGGYLTGGGGCITLLTKAPHPNAAKLFLNWLLTKEGQTILSKGTSRQSARLDVPTDFLPEWTKRKPGVKYFNTYTEELIKESVESRKVFAEIFSIK